jgi:hypothetical protein
MRQHGFFTRFLVCVKVERVVGFGIIIDFSLLKFRGRIMNFAGIIFAPSPVHRWIGLLLVALTPMATAQVTSARLSGYVFDASGTRMSGVSVTATNTATNLTERVRSSQAGEYRFSALPAGRYTLTISNPGFVQLVQEGVILTLGQSATLNFRLSAGSAHDKIVLKQGARPANTTTAEVSHVIGENSIEDLPLNGRDPSSLQYLSAGVTDETISQGAFPQTNQSFSAQTGASAGGGRQGSTWYLLDGVPNMDTTTLLAAPFPNADATQEFRVITNSFDAEYGFAPDAVVNIQTKSGSNDFHGGVFEFLRNYAADAKLYTFPGGLPDQSDNLRRNQFGAYAGGPLRKDKLFLFADFQETRNSYTQEITESTPTAAMLQGDFSAALDPNGKPVQLHGPMGQPDPFNSQNQINPALFSKGAVGLDKLIPVSKTDQVSFTQPAQRTNYSEGTGRLDYVRNPSQRMFVRLFIDDLGQPDGYIPGNILSGFPGEHGIDLNAAVNHVWTVSPTLLNSLTAAYISYDFVSGTAVQDAVGNSVCLSQFIQVNDPPGKCFINLRASAGYYGEVEGFNVFSGQLNQTDRRDWLLSDTLTKVVGKHTLAAGTDLLHRHFHEFNGGPANPVVGFNGSYTGFLLADFLMGYAQSFSQQGADEAGVTDGWMVGLYLEDEYKLRPDLTLSAGLRWDPNISPTIAGDRGAAYVPGAQSTRFPKAPQGLLFAGEQGVPGGLIGTTYGYFQPRIGIAWAVTPRTSVRAGFGLFTTPLEDAFFNRVWDANPFSQSYTIPTTSSTPVPFDTPWTFDASTGGVSPFPPFPPPDSTPPRNSTFASPTILPAVFATNFKTGMTESWNLFIDRQFFGTVDVRAGYVGSESYHQATAVDQNPGVPGIGGAREFASFGSILQVQDGTTANYNSLQAGVEKRFSRGFEAQSSFTWSKTFDVSSSGDPIFGISVSDPTDVYHDHGLSAFNYPFIWTSSFIYRAPHFRSENKSVRNAFGGWELSGLYKAFSGPAFTVNCCYGDGNNNSSFDEGQDRPDSLPGVPTNVRKGGRSNWLQHYMNPNAFQINRAGTAGNVPKYNMQQPPIQDVDLALLKHFTYRERDDMEFRFEAFNALNHPSFCQPDSELGDADFGAITCTGPVSPRVLQAAVKITF